MAKFPNLFIIGSMKSGTSSLHEYLHQHPEIFMSRMKEPQYFAPHLTRSGQAWGAGNPNPEPGIDWYLKLSEEAGDVKYAGESSVSYTARPWVEDCEKRIFKFNPDAKLIFIMRDPVKRAISHYWHFVKDGREDRTMLKAFRDKEEYISRSDYYRQLIPFIQTFGKEKVFTLTLEELNESPQRIFRELFHWLEVDADFEMETSKRFNVAEDSVLQTRRHLVCFDTMIKHKWRWKQVEKYLPNSVEKLLRKSIYKEVHKDQVDTTEAIEFIRPVLKEKTAALVDLLRREFPEWTTLNS